LLSKLSCKHVLYVESNNSLLPRISSAWFLSDAQTNARLMPMWTTDKLTTMTYQNYCKYYVGSSAFVMKSPVKLCTTQLAMQRCN